MPPITMTSVNLSEEAAKLLDFSQKLDITLLDNIVTMMYTGNGPQVFIELEYRYSLILLFVFIHLMGQAFAKIAEIRLIHLLKNLIILQMIEECMYFGEVYFII